MLRRSVSDPLFVESYMRDVEILSTNCVVKKGGILILGTGIIAGNYCGFGLIGGSARACELEKCFFFLI